MRKIIAIATAITIAIIISMACAIPASAERTNTIYTLDVVIVSWELEHGDYKVTCLDENGDLWEFYDEIPWNIGDIAIIQLYAFDDDYTHDEILDIEYCGSLELHELAYYILEATGHNALLLFGCYTSKTTVSIFDILQVSQEGNRKEGKTMNKTFISITITHYSNKRITPDVHYYVNNGVDPSTSRWDMSVNEANRRMWELVRMGGKNEYRSNPYNNAISERHVAFWGLL